MLCWKDGKNTDTHVSIYMYRLHDIIMTFCKPMSFKNTVEKGENAGNQHFLLFPHCFVYHIKDKFIISRSHWKHCGKRRKCWLPENIAGMGENDGNQHFLLFPQCFLAFQKQIWVFQLYLLSAKALKLDQSKILSFGKRVKYLLDISYSEVLNSRSSLITETDALRQQNAELRMLLHQYVNSKVSLLLFVVPHFDTPKIYSCGKHCEKRRNCL